jgi:N-acetylneuraminic acid mutarotase
MKRETFLILTVLMFCALLVFSEMSLARKGKWTEKTPLLVPRGAHVAPVVNGKIYVIGGANGNIFSFVDEYNPKADRWRKKADAPGARARSTASVVDGKIYVIGGIASRGHVYVVDMYNPVADIWTKKADMLTQRDVFSAGVVNGKIYVIGGGKSHNNGPGGFIGLSTVEEYDPVTNRWTKKANMPTKRVLFATGVVRGKIYAIGGLGINKMAKYRKGHKSLRR